jgi:MOSC domain-containing protein YiiM
VHRQEDHVFSKTPRSAVELVEGLGVRGDAHCGATVKHRSRVARNPDQPNLRHVHLLHAELFAEVAAAGFTLGPGQLGKNITVRGLALLGLSAGTRLQLGPTAVVELTGMHNPRHQMDDFQPGLLAAVLGRSVDGTLIRRAGVMAIVVTGGRVQPEDAIRVVRAPRMFQAMQPV